MTRALVGVLLCIVALPAAARQLTHAPVPGETLEDVALRYYGSAQLAASLRTHNSLEPGSGPGRVIEVPLFDEHRVESGESWSRLAERYWGDPGLADAMPALVEPAGAALEPGQALRIPALIRHQVEAGESFAVLSRRCYGNSERALAIARLNGIEHPDRLWAGTRLRLPVFGEVVAMPAAPPPPVAAPPPASPDLTRALADAIEAYHHGEFHDARSALETLRPPILESGSPDQRRVLLEHLLRVHAAFDEPEQVCASLDALALRGEDLDPERFSPKVRELADACP